MMTIPMTMNLNPFLPLLAGAAAAFVAVGSGVAVLWAARRRSTVSAADRARIARAWSRVGGLRDPARRVMEAEKAFDLLLQCWGRRGTFVEKFRGVEWRFSNREAVWHAHKLRNRIAHESGAEPKKAEAERAVQAFRAALEQFTGAL